MKILSVEEAKDLFIITSGRQSKVSGMVSLLKVGEALIITRADWPSKKPPYDVINYLAKKTGRTFQKGRMPDGSAWVVKRLS